MALCIRGNIIVFILQIKEGIDVLVGIKSLQILDGLADPDILNRNSQLRLNGDGNSSLGGTVHLGQDDACDIGGRRKLSGLDQGILTTCRIQYCQSLTMNTLVLTVDHPVDFFQLMHEICLVVEPSRRID